MRRLLIWGILVVWDEDMSSPRPTLGWGSTWRPPEPRSGPDATIVGRSFRRAGERALIARALTLLRVYFALENLGDSDGVNPATPVHCADTTRSNPPTAGGSLQLAAPRASAPWVVCPLIATTGCRRQPAAQNERPGPPDVILVS